MASRCLHCKTELGKGKPFIPKNIGMKYCMESEECISAWRNDQKHGFKPAKTKYLKQEKVKLREKTKTLSDYEAEAKKSFQKFIRLRDAGKPCISCGNPNPSDWCGSHFFAAGVYSGMIFDERNCNGACNTYCNKYLSGNLISYRQGLIERFSATFVEQLEKDANERKNYKYSKIELIEIKKKYDLKIKELLKCR